MNLIDLKDCYFSKDYLIDIVFFYYRQALSFCVRLVNGSLTFIYSTKRKLDIKWRRRVRDEKEIDLGKIEILYIQIT